MTHVTRIAAFAAVGCLAIASCGGGSDDGADTTVPDEIIAADTETTESVTTEAATTTEETTPTTPDIIVDGATVVVANASGVGGSAGAMSEELEGVGFTTGTPTNSTESLTATIVHFTDAAGAEAVAQSVGQVLGGVDVIALPESVPTESGELEGGEVLVLVGTDTAGRTIDQIASGEEVEVAAPIEAVENNGTNVVVANGNTIGGSAGRMSDQLSDAGFAVGTPINASSTVDSSLVYYGSAEGAQADAESVAALLGGVDVLALPEAAPVEGGEFDGDVLVVLGAAEADQPLSSL